LSNSRTIFNQWGGSTTAFFCYTHFSHDLAVGLLVPLLPFIREDLGLTYLESGLLVAAFTISAGLSQFPGGWLGDHLNRMVVVAIALGSIGLISLAIGLSSSYYILLFLLITMGIFAGLYHPSVVSMLSGYLKEKRGKGLAFHLAGGNIGFAIGPVLGGIIAGVLGWRFAYIILSLPVLTGLFMVLVRLRKREGLETASRAATSEPTQVPSPARPPRRLSGLRLVFRAVAAVFILSVLTHLVANTAMAFLSIYLVDKHGLAPSAAAIWLGVTRGGGVVGALFGGWLFDRWGRRKAILLALGATGPLLYLLTKLEFGPLLMVVLFLFGAVMLMRQATVQPFLMDNAPPYLRATVLGIYFGLGMQGSSMFQPVAGHFMDVYGIENVFNIIAITSLILSVAAFLLVKQIRQRSAAASDRPIEV